MWANWRMFSDNGMFCIIMPSASHPHPRLTPGAADKDKLEVDTQLTSLIIQL